MIRLISRAVADTEAVTKVIDREAAGVSEDASYLISRVQAEGGEATYVGIGASNPAGHHTAYFDIDEAALNLSVDVLVTAIRRL